MHRITPSFIGTTLATIVAAAYTFMNDEPAFYLWTSTVRFAVICGPALVLITYSIATFLVETHPVQTLLPTFLGRSEYWIRVLAQIFLCLSLAALSENIRLYIVLFVLFIATNFLWSFSARKSMPRLFRYDAMNFVICLLYAYVALHVHSLAAEFQKTYPAFVTDRNALAFRVTELRGEQTDWITGLCVAFGGLIVNLMWTLRHLFNQLVEALKTSRATNAE